MFGNVTGRGGSASGRVTDFCRSRPGLNLRSTLGFFGQTVSILDGRLPFLISTNHRTQTMSSSSLLSCFQSSLWINIVCPSISCYQCTKREINPKRGQERPIFKKNAWKFNTLGITSHFQNHMENLQAVFVHGETNGQVWAAGSINWAKAGRQFKLETCAAEEDENACYIWKELDPLRWWVLFWFENLGKLSYRL